ncbi:MAG: ABC transporter permease [Candidatus Nanopelagicales bacterium]
MPVNAVAVTTDDAAAAVTSIEQAVPGVTAYEKAEAVSLIPGVGSISQTFGILVGLTFVIGIVVIGFFFLILTVQKLKSFTLLRALGASPRRLAGVVVQQITVVVLVASAIAVVLTLLAVRGLNSGIPVSLAPGLVIGSDRERACFLPAGRPAQHPPGHHDRPVHRGRCPMMLALNEIRRGLGRFVSIIGALSLITFLVLTLSALADGLFFGATGAVRSTNASAYAFSSDAKGSLIRSTMTPAAGASKLQDAPGVTKASGVGVLLTAGRGPSEEYDLAIFGVDPAGAGVPTNLSEGRLPGRRLGRPPSMSHWAPALVTRSPWARSPSRWLASRATPATSCSRLSGRHCRPGARCATMCGRSSPALRTTSMRCAIEGSPQGEIPGVTVLSAQDTGLAIPGVEQQASTLNSIIYTTLAVAALVVALFFALIVLEKRELFAALKALGTPTRKLGAGVVLQAVIASAIGVVVGAIASRALGAVVPDTVPTLFRTETLISIAIFVLVAGVVGAAFSLRRIARIDPATAIGGTL